MKFSTSFYNKKGCEKLVNRYFSHPIDFYLYITGGLKLSKRGRPQQFPYGQ